MARTAVTVDELVSGVLSGDRRALARAISLVENRDAGVRDLISAVYPHTGNAVTVGVTGPPGAGKSTLAAALVGVLREQERTVGVVSVDPSSPFTRGALLGDRIRLAEHFLDPGVFIRSMGARGHLGGLAEGVLQTVLLLDAAGYDVILVETVGAGQSEVEVAGVADVVVLVLMPGSGDSVQALKAGIMEIPDVIVVNKVDAPASDTLLREVRSVVSLDPDPAGRPAVAGTDALRGTGVEELWHEVESRRSRLVASGELEERRRRNLTREVLALASARARERIERALAGDAALEALVERVTRRELDPVSAADAVAAKALGGGDGAPTDGR